MEAAKTPLLKRLPPHVRVGIGVGISSVLFVWAIVALIQAALMRFKTPADFVIYHNDGYRMILILGDGTGYIVQWESQREELPNKGKPVGGSSDSLIYGTFTEPKTWRVVANRVDQWKFRLPDREHRRLVRSLFANGFYDMDARQSPPYSLSCIRVAERRYIHKAYIGYDKDPHYRGYWNIVADLTRICDKQERTPVSEEEMLKTVRRYRDGLPGKSQMRRLIESREVETPWGW